MTKFDKLFQKFLDNPASISYLDLKKILLTYEFEYVKAKGSHKKFKHSLLERDLIIPVHSNDCKNFYKEQAAKTIKKLIKNHGISN